MTETESTAPVIGEEQIALLEKLSNACGVSGDEGEVRAIVIEQVKAAADEFKIDALGNVLATRKAKTSKPALKVLVAAHMDEVGFMLVEGEEGLYRFEVVGGIDLRQLPGKPVWVGKEHTPGVIGARPIHLTTAEERKNTITLETLRIDLGLGSTKVKVGDRATFATRFRQIGPSLAGKALDNRLGVAALIELFKHAPANIELCAAFTTQEEVGARGAHVAAYSYAPDIAIALDTTPAYDLPVWDDSENAVYNSHLGQGPAIYVADGSTISDPRLVRYLAQTGDALNLAYQFRQPGGGGTDAGGMQRQREGIPSVSLSVPHRYTHSAISLARLSDWQGALNLLYQALLRLPQDILQQPFA